MKWSIPSSCGMLLSVVRISSEWVILVGMIVPTTELVQSHSCPTPLWRSLLLYAGTV